MVDWMLRLCYVGDITSVLPTLHELHNVTHDSVIYQRGIRT